MDKSELKNAIREFQASKKPRPSKRIKDVIENRDLQYNNIKTNVFPGFVTYIVEGAKASAEGARKQLKLEKPIGAGSRKVTNKTWYLHVPVEDND